MERRTVKERLYWCYANLAMAHSAVKRSPDSKRYSRVHYMIRAKLYKGLVSGTMSIRSLFDDEREKIKDSVSCSFCGSSSDLSVDHLVSRFNGGSDSGDNLIATCRICNSSKGKKDLLEWYEGKEEFPPLMTFRRYLKLCHTFASERGILEMEIEGIDFTSIPFRIDLWLDPRKLAHF